MPTSVAGEVIAAAGGESHSVAVLADGSVVAWGSDAAGQSSVPGGLGIATAVGAGLSHSLAVLDDGSVVAWGRAKSG